jgi:hypothetical protein
MAFEQTFGGDVWRRLEFLFTEDEFFRDDRRRAGWHGAAPARTCTTPLGLQVISILESPFPLD